MQPELQSGPALPPLKPVNILLVDDEPRNLDVLESILASPELRLVRSANPDEALLALVQEEFACIVLDINLPGMSGLELARLIKTRRRNHNIPIIFLTAFFHEEKDVLQGYGAGAVDYLTKPINPQIFKSKVGVFVDLFRTARALAVANAALEEEVVRRKNAEEALWRSNQDLEERVRERTAEVVSSEARYRHVVRNLPAAIYSIDAEGRITFYNDVASELWGRRPEIGKELWSGAHKLLRADGSELKAEDSPMATTLKCGTPVRGQEIVIERPDGTRRNILPYPTPIHDSTGKVIGAVNMLLDITERNLAQLVSQRFAAIVESSDDAIVGKDLQGIVNSWNHGAERMFQYKAAEITGKPVTLLIPPDRQAEEKEILSKIGRGEPVKHMETVRMRRDGSLIDVSLTISPVKDINGNILGASKIARDITERKHAEREQRALYELVTKINRCSVAESCAVVLDTILECQNCQRAAVLLLDPAGAMRFEAARGLSDDYCRAMEGHSPWKTGEQPQPVLITDVAEAGLEEPLRTSVEREGIRALAFIPIVYGELLLGKFMLHYDSVHPFTLDELRPIRTIASQIALALERERALRELKNAHAGLMAASRAKDDFLATLSHELRTPLNPVLLIASDSARNRDLPPQVRADFHSIRKNVELEARLIDDLLDLTRIARGKISLNKHLVDAHRVVQDAIANVREEVDKKQITLNLNLIAPRHTVYADGVRVQQIFLNLLRNALKFTPDQGRITVESGVHDQQLVIKITDTGIGMTPSELERLFIGAFAQHDLANNGRSQRSGGLGLGLAISQKLAELHSGRIHAASEGLNLGSTFTVELPLARGLEQKSANSSAPPPESSAKLKTLQILLVEDHPPTRSALTHLLIRRSFKVKAAASLAEARILADTQSFDLLISDIGLPDGTGYDLMEEFRDRFPFPGIALTGYGMEQDVARSKEAGFLTHLTKPVRVEALDDAINSVLKSGPALEMVSPEETPNGG